MKRKEIFFNKVLARDGEIPILEGVGETNRVEIPLLRGGDEVDGVEKTPSWQAKSLFPFWKLPKNKKLQDRAKKLRKAGNLSEVLFWKAFKDKKKLGWDIDRQVIIGNYIVDFFIAELGLVIEIDGSSHNDKEEYDKERVAYLRGLGLEVINYLDIDIKKNIYGIDENFRNAIKKRIEFLKSANVREESTPPNPLDLPPLKRGISTPSSQAMPPLKMGRDADGTSR